VANIGQLEDGLIILVWIAGFVLAFYLFKLVLK